MPGRGSFLVGIRRASAHVGFFAGSLSSAKERPMAVIKAEVRSGADVRFRSSHAAAACPGGTARRRGRRVVMGTGANKELLAQSSLLVAEVEAAGNDDLIIVVRGAWMQVPPRRRWREWMS